MGQAGVPGIPVECRDVDIERQKDMNAIVSMMVFCNDVIIIEHEERRPGLSNVPAVMDHDNHRTD